MIQTSPVWLTRDGSQVLNNGYLMKGETPRDMYRRLAATAAKRLKKPELEEKIFHILWMGWLCPATPVLTNFGTNRGLPASCYGSVVGDTLNGPGSIFDSFNEFAALTKGGGAVGYDWSGVRPAGTPIRGGINGTSGGVIPWLKIADSTTYACSQGSVRRGAYQATLNVEHGDYLQFLNIRQPKGDISTFCGNLNHSALFTDEFMQRVKNSDSEAVSLWLKTLTTSVQFSQPYKTFSGNANRILPQWYKDAGLRFNNTNLCLTGDTKVTTSLGSFPIKDLVNKTVTIFDGNSWVTNDQFKLIEQNVEVMRITLADNSYVDCTLDHGFFLEDGTKILAKDIKVGTKLLSHTQESHGNKTTEGAYIKGFLCGDGTHIDDRPLLWLYDTKYSCMQRLIDSAEEIKPKQSVTNQIDELGFKTSTDNRKNMQGLSARKDELYPWTTTNKVKLPQEVFEWDLVSKCEFIAGLFDADGCAMQSSGSYGYQLGSIHKSFLYDLQTLLKTLGVNSTISVANKEGLKDFNDGYGEYLCKDSWRLTISSVAARKLAKLVTFTRLVSFRDLTGYNAKCKFNKVKAVELLEDKQDVYCTTVNTTHMFALSIGLLSSNCTEIILPNDDKHSYVCVLSSLNVAKYDEWKDDPTVVQLAIWFLDAVMEEWLELAKDLPGFERVYLGAVKSRALGLGILGWHTFLQQKLVPFESPAAVGYTNNIMKFIRQNADIATKDLAKEYGEPEWLKGTGRRNGSLLAIAPTRTNAIISGQVSYGIQPIGNYYADFSAKGAFIVKNPVLIQLLKAKGIYSQSLLNSLLDNGGGGSIQHIHQLSDLEKEVFKTPWEINPIAIINQAAKRQEWLDQGQSVDLFFSKDKNTGAYSGQQIHNTHMAAYDRGLATIYYTYGESAADADSATRVAARQMIDVGDSAPVLTVDTSLPVDSCGCEG